MRVGFIILCRYNSTRLPGKILKLISGKPILQHIFERLLLVTEMSNIVVATSSERTDNPISEYCIENHINIYRGNLENVAERFLNCAINYNFDFAARINGDNIFIDTEILAEMLAIVQMNNFDFVSNVKKRTFPKGMSIEIVRVVHYQKLYNNFQSSDDFEHVTYYLYQNDQNEKYYYYYNILCPEAAGIQLAIDTEEDFKLVKSIFSKYILGEKEYNLIDIYQFYKSEQNEKESFQR